MLLSDMAVGVVVAMAVGHGTGLVVMEKKRVTKKYCPNCHRSLPKSQQPKIGMTQGQFEQSLGRILLFLMLAVVGFFIVF